MDTPVTTQRTAIFDGLVSPEWQDRGHPLSMAWRKFESNELRTAIKYALAFERANSANQTDDDEGYENALSFAAQVAEGGAFDTYENKKAGLMFKKFQKLAEVEIWHRLRSGLLAAYGSPNRRGAPFEWISPFAWQGLRRITENSNDISGDGNLYYNVYVVGLTPLPHAQSSAPKTAATGPEAAIEPIKPHPQTSTTNLNNFITDYIKNASQSGANPTKRGLEKAWLDGGHVGKRDQLRSEFQKQMGMTAGKRGRPRKFAAK